MHVHEALAQIADIRRQMDRTRLFRGYRAATTLFTALLAVAAASWQAWAVPDAALHPGRFIDLWVGVAVVSLVVVGVEVAVRYRRSDSSLHRELTLLAVEQFLPCVIVGGLVTVVLTEFAWPAVWMLPGLWCIFFGLGVVASRRLLPGAVAVVGAFYLLCGLWCLACGRAAAFSPMAMGVPFGVGQTAAALILHLTLERRHEAE